MKVSLLKQIFHHRKTWLLYSAYEVQSIMLSGCFFFILFFFCPVIHGKLQCLDLGNYWMDFYQTLHGDRASGCPVQVYLKI